LCASKISQCCCVCFARLSLYQSLNKQMLCFKVSYVLIHFKPSLCFHNWIPYSSVFEISLYFFSRTLLKTIGFETLQLLAICISTFVENSYFYTLFIHNTYTSWGSQSWLTWLDIIRRTMWKTLSSSAASLFFIEFKQIMEPFVI
jgi:hypothetical protein